MSCVSISAPALPAQNPHPDFEVLNSLMPTIREYQALALKHGIEDVFQDNGGKVLQMLLALNLEGIPGRQGNDAVDADGDEYELKGLNIRLTDGFSTNHHVNLPTIRKYRLARWVFAIFEGIEMRRAYAVPTDVLEVYFSSWEEKWRDEVKDINNPKIPLNFVIEHGHLIYTDYAELDLVAAAATRKARSKTAAKRRKAKVVGQMLLPGLQPATVLYEGHA